MSRYEFKKNIGDKDDCVITNSRYSFSSSHNTKKSSTIYERKTVVLTRSKKSEK